MEAAAQAAHTKLPKGVIVLLVVLRMSWGNLLIYITNFNIYVFFFFLTCTLKFLVFNLW